MSRPALTMATLASRLEACRRSLARIERDMMEQTLQAPDSPVALTVKRTVQAAAIVFRTHPNNILTHCREAEAVNARMACYSVAAAIAGHRMTELGRAFGRSHGTVCKGLQSARNWISTDPAFAAKVQEVKRLVEKEIKSV